MFMYTFVCCMHACILKSNHIIATPSNNLTLKYNRHPYHHTLALSASACHAGEEGGGGCGVRSAHATTRSIKHRSNESRLHILEGSTDRISRHSHVCVCVCSRHGAPVRRLVKRWLARSHKRRKSGDDKKMRHMHLHSNETQVYTHKYICMHTNSSPVLAF